MASDLKYLLKPTLPKLLIAALLVFAGVLNFGFEQKPLELHAAPGGSLINYWTGYKFFGPSFAPTMYEKCVKQTQSSVKDCSIVPEWPNIAFTAATGYLATCILIYAYGRLVKR